MVTKTRIKVAFGPPLSPCQVPQAVLGAADCITLGQPCMSQTCGSFCHEPCFGPTKALSTREASSPRCEPKGRAIPGLLSCVEAVQHPDMPRQSSV